MIVRTDWPSAKEREAIWTSPHSATIESIPSEPAERTSSRAAATRWLMDRQRRDGYWVAELEGDTILESEAVLLKAFLGELDDAGCVQLCRYLRAKQRPEGGWSIFPDGPFDLSASVKAYFALKLVGVPIDDPDMARARDLILEAGGARACNSFTRFYLALLGQVDYDECPYVPPELVLLPSWLPFSLAAMSAWTRTMVVPLSIISAKRPVTRLRPEQSIAELMLEVQPTQPPPLSWSRFFIALDRSMKWLDRRLPQTWRRRGLRAAHRWMLNHFENSDGLGAIYPPMIYTIIVLRTLGYSKTDPTYQWAVQQLDDLAIDEPTDQTRRIQPCVSPVWDTAITMIALADAAEADPGLRRDVQPALRRSARWLASKEIRIAGDWQARRRFQRVEASGWSFEFLNEHYADIDDTAMVLLALHRSGLDDDPAIQSAIRRGVGWLLALQGRDGGWAAFDADIDNQVLTKVPFADHNAMLDPSCPDITARVLELLGTLGCPQDHPAVARGLDFLWGTQEPEGCWFGRWGVNYIYGTWQVLQGMAALGLPMTHPRLKRAADWLESVQDESGGWGETCASYEDRRLMGQGRPTASQTAWAVLGLLAAGRGDGPAVERGLRWLIDTQTADGDWDEEDFTGTGFPKVFYLRYHYYRVYFPLMALSRSGRAGA